MIALSTIHTVAWAGWTAAGVAASAFVVLWRATRKERRERRREDLLRRLGV